MKILKLLLLAAAVTSPVTMLTTSALASGCAGYGTGGWGDPSRRGAWAAAPGGPIFRPGPACVTVYRSDGTTRTIPLPPEWRDDAGGGSAAAGFSPAPLPSERSGRPQAPPAAPRAWLQAFGAPGFPSVSQGGGGGSHESPGRGVGSCHSVGVALDSHGRVIGEVVRVPGGVPGGHYRGGGGFASVESAGHGRPMALLLK